jgi:phosphatidylinositol glycan class T
MVNFSPTGMRHLFNRKLSGKCPVSKSSRIFIEVDKGIVDKVNKSGSDLSWNNEFFVSLIARTS